MDRRLTTAHGVGPLLVATVVALALVMALGATPASAASPTACRVQSTITGKTYTALQPAVDAAKRGDRLTVRGTCHGPTVIDRNLVIEGIRAASRPLLTGDLAGVVLTVRKGVTATVKDLAIEGGRGHFREGGPKAPYNWPAGVRNHGSLTLHSVAVKLNRGVGIENTGRLRLSGNALVNHNGLSRAYVFKGIHNTGTLRMNGRARVGLWDNVENDGILVMNGASIIDDLMNRGTGTLHGTSSAWQVSNRGTLSLGDQSRIDGRGTSVGTTGVDNYGILTLNDTSSIIRAYIGVGNAPGSTVVLNGQSVIRRNSIGIRNHGTVTLNGSSSIRDNHLPEPSKCPYGCRPIGGAGVFNSGTLVLNDSSSIRGNSVSAWRAGSYGGGVYMVRDVSLPEPPSLTMTGSSTINGNAAGGPGGGVYAGAGSVLTGVSCAPQTLANVYGNTPDDCYLEP